MNNAEMAKVLIIGSGIGGLSIGIILAKLGFEVTVVEKNRQSVRNFITPWPWPVICFPSGV